MTGAAGDIGPTGPTGATGTSLTANSAFAANTSGSVIPVILGGSSVSLPNSQNIGPGISIDGTNTTFTVSNAGAYYITYNINLTAALAISSRLIINGSPNTASTVAPILSSSSFTNNIIVDLTTNSTITLQLFGLLGAATLISGGAGASLSIIRLR
nr:collagen-like triple helix repeat-containing protein [Clostridium yunnanense]